MKICRLAVTVSPFCLAFLLCTGVKSQNVTPAAATDVTVRLFFSQHVFALNIHPVSRAATFRRCSSCPQLPLTSSLRVTLKDSTMLVNNARVPALEISGAVKVDTASGRSATAAGRWRLRPSSDGLRLTLTLPSERYVLAVLASEASPDEPAASLQALAIAARSFALTHLNRHRAEDFDLCDSTHCQALRLAPISGSIRSAVEATAGETIWTRSHRATAYFTQNCGGVTEDAVQLWGGSPQPWLTSHPDPWCQRTASAWHASLSQQELQEALTMAGLPTNAPISTLRIAKRDPAGRASTLAIVTAGRQIQLPAATFRFAVGRALGWNRLRSDWYAVNFAEGTAHFDGKGFGHGVGLCQAGAAAMATQQHADARAILRFYFPGTDVRIDSSDQGWLSASGHGWTLFHTSSSDTATLLREGDLAWKRAQALLGGPSTDASDTHPVSVRVYPSTELFRSSTGEPGWVIAATRGDVISLQPLRVVQAHESLTAALLHEMLHVLVERQSSAATPLWLREGLVEALGSDPSADHHARAPAVTLDAINAALSAPSSFDQSSHAHQAAAEIVRRLIDVYGIAEVRGWLSRSVPASALAQASLR